MRYYLYNPTGNITALVQEGSCLDVMQLEPSCEQAANIYEEQGYDIALRMSGGEFCGNACMCAAALAAKKMGIDDGNFTVFVDGTGPVKTRIKGGRGSVEMPKPLEIAEFQGYPMVRFKGIDHLIVNGIPENKKHWEQRIRQWCSREALGIMFLNGSVMTPLVYVKESDTLFWESSCASGTSAVGFLLDRDIKLKEPAGEMEFSNGVLSGKVELIKEISQPDE